MGWLILRVRLAGRRPNPAPNGVTGRRWLVGQWPEGDDEPAKYWISNLPADLPARDLFRLAKLRWQIQHDCRESRTTLGLDHFAAGTATSPSSPPIPDRTADLPKSP
ncbi:hypothetical protein ACWIGX_24230 [Streptomyces nigrescens]